MQQGSAGGSGGILVTFLNQAQTLVGSWNSTDGLNAQGGQLTETSVVLGSANVSDAGAFDSLFAGIDLTEVQRAAVIGNIRNFTRLGAGIAGAPGIIAGYTAGTTTTTNTTPGAHNLHRAGRGSPASTFSAGARARAAPGAAPTRGRRAAAAALTRASRITRSPRARFSPSR